MSAADVLSHPVPTESKSSKKKKAKAAAIVAAANIDRTNSPAPGSDRAGSVAPQDGDESENLYIRELQKNIRNVNKKLTNASKTDNLIGEHADKSLEELVNLRIINADQKAQHLKKPALQEQLNQLNEQLAMHLKIDNDHKARLAALEERLMTKFAKEKEELVAENLEKNKVYAEVVLENSLFTLTKFLRLAAQTRADPELDANGEKALSLEGVLLHVYTGDRDAVDTMLKLVHGKDEPTVSTTGEKLEITFADVKRAADASYTPLIDPENPAAQEQLESNSSVPNGEATEAPQTDPTLANAALTEIDDGSAIPLANGHAEEESKTNGHVPANAYVTDAAAITVGNSQWHTDNQKPADEISQEWVDVRNPCESAETRNEAAATAAAPHNAQSWADDHPEPPAGDPPSTGEQGDGFHKVQRGNRVQRESGNGGRGRGGGERGGFRGRGGYRGDGRSRGRGRGRGRGGFRGGSDET